MQDMKNNLSIAPSLHPAARTATAQGTGVDLRGYEGAMIAVTSGVVTDGTHTITLEESDDNSAWSDVATADILGTEPVLDTTAADDNAVQVFGYRGTKRYIRVISTVAGTTTGGIYGAAVIRGFNRHAPV